MTLPNLDHTYKAVARVTTIGRFFIKSPGRQPVLTHARAVAAKVMRMQGMTWQQIGKELGRSHSSVIELVRDHQRQPRFRRDVAAVSETLKLQDCEARP